MTKPQARPSLASAATAKPVRGAGAESPRPLKHEAGAMAPLSLFSMYFLGAWAGTPGAACVSRRLFRARSTPAPTHSSAGAPHRPDPKAAAAWPSNSDS
jgi:hypothetical protein